MFNLMVKAGRLSRDHVPTVVRLEEAPPRRGFLEPADFARLREALPEYLREPASFLYHTGWRKGAMRTLQWLRDCELEFTPEGALIGGAITLQVENSKNKTALDAAAQGRAARGDPARVGSSPLRMPLRVSRWQSAHRRLPEGLGIGLQGCRSDRLLVHDLRRSCARNLVRSGVPERVVMMVTGHKTRCMLDRYNIVSAGDLEAAMTRVSAYVTARAAEPAKPKVVALARKVA